MSKDYLINERIRVRTKEVRLIDSDGTQLGIVPTEEALEKARNKDMDLILIAPTAKPPVCKIENYGKLKYEITKKEKEARKGHRTGTLKEFKLSPKIEKHDLEVRIRKTTEFLKERHKVKIGVFFRGREVTHAELGMNLLNIFAERIADVGIIEQPAKMEGKNLFMVLAPK